MDLPEKVVMYVLNQQLSRDETIDKLRSLSGARGLAASRNHQIDNIRKEAEKKIKALRDQQLCQHEVIETHGDPSGGSDSEDWCLVCGDCVTRKAVRFT